MAGGGIAAAVPVTEGGDVEKGKELLLLILGGLPGADSRDRFLEWSALLVGG